MPICYGELGLTGEQIGELSVYEIVNMAHGYEVRRRAKENMIAQLVTLWIANTAGKVLKKELTMSQIFKDGRFASDISTDEIQEILQEYYE